MNSWLQRTLYQGLMQGRDKNKFRKNCRSYVSGALYQDLSSNVLKVDWRKQGDMDIAIDLLNRKGEIIGTTTVMVRDAKNHKKFLAKIKHLGSAVMCKGQGNARSGKGDRGKMFAVGCRSLKDGNPVLYSNTLDVAHVLPDVSIGAAKFGAVQFPQVLKSIRRTERSAGVLPPKEMGGSAGICCSGDISIDLGNSSHYDKGDASVGFSVWASLTSNRVSNWFFVLPNLRGTYNGRQFEGIAIALYDGAAVSWDGRWVRHCTALPTIDNGQHLFGMFFAAKKRFL